MLEPLKKPSSPYINRFLRPDTLIPDPTNPQALNRYTYVMNNPIRYADPSGHIGCDEDRNGKCVSYEYKKKFSDSDIKKTVIHIGFGSMVWSRDGDSEPHMSAGGYGLGTAVDDRSTIVTANHILQEAKANVGDNVPYMFIYGQDQNIFIPIPLNQVTSNSRGDLLVLKLPRSITVPEEYLVANSAFNYTPKALQSISSAYKDETGKVFVYDTRMTTDPIQQHPSYGLQYAAFNMNVLTHGDSGGGVFHNGALIGVNSTVDFSSALFTALNFSVLTIQPLEP